jgi:hypothetical protein
MARAYSLEGRMAELLLKMRHPEGIGGAWNGQSFEVDKDGEIAVPFEAAGDLRDHGFEACGQIGDVEPPEAEPVAEADADAPAPKTRKGL